MIAIKDMEMPSDCYDCPFAKNKRTNDYGSFCECGILEDYETINLYEHSKHPNCPLVEIEERKVGKWITKDGKEQGYDIAGIKTWYKQIMCNKCGFIKTALEGYAGQRNYCPNCGAEMRGSE